MAKRLTEAHPFMQRVNALYDYMKENKITIDFAGNDSLLMIDDETGHSYRLKDAESGEGELTFPTLCEFKLVTE